jgi:hypothetical protein
MMNGFNIIIIALAIVNIIGMVIDELTNFSSDEIGNDTSIYNYCNNCNTLVRTPKFISFILFFNWKSEYIPLTMIIAQAVNYIYYTVLFLAGRANGLSSFSDAVLFVYIDIGGYILYLLVCYIDYRIYRNITGKDLKIN